MVDPQQLLVVFWEDSLAIVASIMINAGHQVTSSGDNLPLLFTAMAWLVQIWRVRLPAPLELEYRVCTLSTNMHQVWGDS